MCWSSQYQLRSNGGSGDGDPLTITSFFVRLLPYESSSIPDSLTLLYLRSPCSSDGNGNNNLEIDNKIPPYFPATVSLRRLRLPNADGNVIFGSKQRVHATTQVLSFQLYLGEAKLLKGAFKKDEDHHHRRWKLECRANTTELQLPISISEAEIWAALDGHVPIGDRIRISIPEKPMPMAMVVNKYKKRNNKYRSNKLKLESELQGIPEETELRMATDEDADAGNDDADSETEIHLEMDLEGLRRAMDMGIWVLCLGFAVGYMVSKASFTKFRLPPPSFF